MMKTMIPKWEDEVNEEDNAGDDGDHAKSHSSLGHEQKSTFRGSLIGWLILTDLLLYRLS